jgi:hypothetical protein
MRDHLKVLGWLHVVNGALVLLVAAVIGTVLGVAGAASAAAALGIVGFAIAIVIGAIGLPSLICGWGLLNYRPWARTLGIVLSVLNLPSFPMGTVLGGYGLWVLLNDESKRVLEAGDPRYRQVGAGW